MKVGAGVSRERDPQIALQEAYRRSLQKIGVTKAEFSLIFYSYDFGLDPAAFSACLKKVFRDIPHVGCSTWSAWFHKEGFEADSGILIVSFKDLKALPELFKVHSLKEKAELWSAELSRQIEDRSPTRPRSQDILFVMADSLNFNAGAGFTVLERHFPGLQICGFGASYSVPQVSTVFQGDVHFNTLIGILMRDAEASIGISQNIMPELNPIEINRMSENLLIEIDHKPAFYKLCEHLMGSDDLPMMSPDNFRKHMGDLYLVETVRVNPRRFRTFGDVHNVVSLLGSEMTTGMVAVAQDLDFNREHHLGQKKVKYAEQSLAAVLDQVQSEIPEPSFIFLAVSVARLRDKDRTVDDLSLVRRVYPDVPVLLVSSQGEYLGGANQFAALLTFFK